MSSKVMTNEGPVLEALRGQRLAAGLDLDAVAAVTGLHRPYLELLEQGHVDLLPSSIEPRGFIKAYLGAIGVADPAKIERLSDTLLGEGKPQPATSSPAPARREPAAAPAEIVERPTHAASLWSMVKAVSVAAVLLGISLGFVHFFVPKNNPATVEEASTTSLRPEPGQHGYVTAVEPIHPPKDEVAGVPPSTSSLPTAGQSAVVVDSRAAAPKSHPQPPPPVAVSRVQPAAAVLKAVLEMDPPQVQISEPSIPEPKLPLPVVPELQFALPAVASAEPPKNLDRAGDRPQPKAPPPAAVEPVQVVKAPLPAPTEPARVARVPPLEVAEPEEVAEAPPKAPVQAAAAEPAQAAAAKPAKSPGKPQKILKATEEVWLMIVTESGEAQEMTLFPGETVALDATDSLVIGNAGGVEVLVDGKVQAPLGKKGEVRRIGPGTL